MPKYKLQVFLIFFLSILFIQVVDAKRQQHYLPLFGKVITIDPGHGSIR